MGQGWRGVTLSLLFAVGCVARAPGTAPSPETPAPPAEGLDVTVAPLPGGADIVVTEPPSDAPPSDAPPSDAPPTVDELRAGKNLLPTRVYSEAEDAEVLRWFAGLRVADVADGMDQAGYKNVGLMSPEIHPLWRDTVHFRHRVIGIALTVRYVPTNQPHAPRMAPKDFDAWAGRWYGERSSEPFVPLIRAGSVIVIEDAPGADVGSIGSYNIMAWKLRGAVGVVTGATARDTDEIIAQEMPLYLRQVGRGIRPGRNEVESVNRPVVAGGVLVEPGDVIVADGDGVVVVPRAAAREVADHARATLEADKAGRRDLYQKLGLPADASVR